jgi:hypothetical protein
MITVSDVIAIADFFNDLEMLDRINHFGILKLGERSEDPEMITHIMDLAAREREGVMLEFSTKLNQLRQDSGVA